MRAISPALWSTLLLCAVGCASAPVAPPADRSSGPRVFNVVPKSGPAAAPAPSALNADLCAALRRVAAPRASSANGVGSALLGTWGAALSTAPGKLPHQRLGGAPAIVVDSTQVSANDWYRVVAADGSLGWITGKFVSAAAAAIFDEGGELSDRVLAANADAADVQVHAVPAGATAQIVGGSDAAYPELVSQLGSGGYLDSDWLPWLRVRAGQLEGWLAPSKTGTRSRPGAAARVMGAS